MTRQPASIRRADVSDGPEVRRLVTEFLLQSGFDAPDEARDIDLVDHAYYQAEQRALWIAEDGAGRAIGCVAIDRGEPGIAVLRRLVGDPLGDLVATAVGYARASGFSEVETVIAQGMEPQRDALVVQGFEPAGSNTMLYRLPFQAS